MSLENPTKHFLNTLKKNDLRNHCCDLGIRGIWSCNKDRLIELILEKSQPQNENPLRDEDDEPSEPSPMLRKVLSEVQEIKERLAMKEIEVKDIYEKLRLSNEKLKQANESISKLQGEVDSLKGNRGNLSRNEEVSHEEQKATLLLGDSNLGSIKLSDVAKNCRIRTIKDANVNALKCWINDQLDWIPKNCIIYCGLKDILNNTNPSRILDNLGMVISDLKSKKEDMDIYMCKVAPSISDDDLQARINEFNDELETWSVSNNIHVIDTNTCFRMSNGNVDDMCYGIENELVLNRLGTIKLLECIASKCENFKLNEKWNVIKRTHNLVSQKSDINDIDISDEKEFPPPIYKNPSRVSMKAKNINNANVRDVQFFNNKARNRVQNRGIKPTRTVDHYDNAYHSRDNYYYDSNQYRNNSCYNCGETNHRQPQCRYDHRLRCGNCNALGHKRRWCNYD